MAAPQMLRSRFGDALARADDLAEAARRATAQAMEPLAGESPDLLAVFVNPGAGAAGHDRQEVAAAAEQAAASSGARHVLGCTAGGVIGGMQGVETDVAVSVWAAVLSDVRLTPFHLQSYRTDDSLAVVGMPEPQPDDEVALLCADPYSFPIDAFVEHSNEALPGLALVGGLASRGAEEGRPQLFLDGQTHDGGAVGLVLGGLDAAGVSAAPLVSQGCRPIGPPMVVTRAEGNVVQELAGVTSLTKLEEIVSTLPAEEQALVVHGLQIGVAMDEYAEEHERGDFLVRGVMGADRDGGGLVVGDVVDVGRTVRFQVRDASAADSDLAERLHRFHERKDLGPASGALLFSCNGRGAALFPSADHDVLAVRSGLHTSGVAGFFAAGEIGPVGGRNHLHGFTASLLVFGAPASADGPTTHG